ncbi:MAG: LysM peptidoglycan-binding domain-containing protein [Thermotogae bacterium]|nr:LysM peptidoglycan-binding domain-containing protein [Thermotogota bacterium]MCP5465922.1 LysM peptidoglycan-binding domain-containing protein [Thermotogota bacterium]
MRKLFVFVALIMMMFLLSSCSVFTQKDLPIQTQTLSEHEQSLKLINQQLIALDDKLTKMESKINALSDKIYQDNKNNTFNNEDISNIKDSFQTLDRRIQIVENLVYDKSKSTVSVDYDFSQDIIALNNDISKIRQQISNIQKTSGISLSVGDVTVPEDKNTDNESTDTESYNASVIYNITERIEKLEKTVDVLSSSQEDTFIKDSINSLSQKYNDLEEQLKKSDAYLMQNGNLEDYVNTKLENFDYGKYVNNIVDIRTEQAVSKFYYQNQSDTVIKIKNLENQLQTLTDKVEKISYDLDRISSKPTTSVDEVYSVKVDELEKRVRAALASLGEDEFRALFENKDEIEYEIKAGDTLSQIANAFGMGLSGVDVIMARNNIKDARFIRIGQNIIIPVNNIENYIKWPLESTKTIDYTKLVVKFGDRMGNGTSTGIGILASKNEKVYPVLPGKVVDVGKAENDSYFVKVDHGNSIVTVSYNIATVYVKIGSWVGSDTAIGLLKQDKTFMFELWKSGEPKDPLRLFYTMNGKFLATYYTEWDDKLIYYPTFRITKSGEIPKNYYTIAADPNVLNLGTVVYIPELKDMPNNGFFVVEDTGGKILGNRIDIYVNDVRLANKTNDVTVYVVGKMQEG